MVADVIKSQDSIWLKERLTRQFTEIFQEDNPNFDHNRFRMRACGYIEMSDVKRHPHKPNSERED
jgi:hypothetical protein